MPGEPRITRVREVPPDPSIARAVGRHHTFETAIADLVDNSIDAGAVNVLVRFIERRGEIIGLRAVDDGKGMDAGRLDRRGDDIRAETLIRAIRSRPLRARPEGGVAQPG